VRIERSSSLDVRVAFAERVLLDPVFEIVLVFEVFCVRDASRSVVFGRAMARAPPLETMAL
jgi:hypothetical protein